MLLVAAAAAVCLAQPHFPDYNAKVIEQVGQVSALGSQGLLALFPNDAVKPQQTIVTGPDGYARFQVSDGSTFEVFPNSKMVFREHLGNAQDILNVIIGRVKVVIQHLNGLPNYNKVSSPTAVISVRGTVFDVTVEDEEGTTLVSVDEGLVGVQNLTAPGNGVLVNPGESIRVYRNQPLALRQVDKGSAAREALKAAQDIMIRVWLGRNRGGLGLPGGGATVPGSGSTNGDHGKGAGTTPTAPGAPGAPGSTSTGTTPTAPPSAPGAPPGP
jgi:ferric-dicitrate binding protein FerR (iron transport regulator)